LVTIGVGGAVSRVGSIGTRYRNGGGSLGHNSAKSSLFYLLIISDTAHSNLLRCFFEL